MVNNINAQTWLDQNYPKEQRSEVKILNIKNKKLEGSLDLSDFINLEELDCSSNQLTILDLNECQEFSKIYCQQNQLINLKFNSSKKPKKLKEFFCNDNYLSDLKDLMSFLGQSTDQLVKLNISNNDFSGEGLSSIYNSPNLEILQIGNTDAKKAERGIYNDFCGSLEPLKYSKSLKLLDISSTDIDRDLEYLPDSLEKIYYSIEARPQSRIKKIISQLELLLDRKKREKYEMNNPENWKEIGEDAKWKKVHNGFSREWRKKWENYGFSYEKVKEWIGADLEPWDAGFAHWLVKKGHKPKNQNFSALSIRLRFEYDDIRGAKKDDMLNSANSTPPDGLLTKKQESKIEENYDIERIGIYDKVYPPQLNWEFGKNELLIAPSKLPLRLYNVEKGSKNMETRNTKELKKDVEIIEERNDIKSYATLSYVWGKYDKPDILTLLGRKSLTKAIKSCQLLGIEYLWIDQLCINQENNEEGQKEREQEVPKMRQYYSNADVTLIAIQTDTNIDKESFDRACHDYEEEKKRIPHKDNLIIYSQDILKTIVLSEWFSRSWTFQEGWLSKNTIFMFDNILIDGRFMAVFWGNFEWMGNSFGKNFNSFFETHCTKKIATPLGWAYYREGYSLEDKVSLSLSEALQATKFKGRSISVDGIYSILGLLPYGEKVGVNYSISATEALSNVMKTAVENGYGEPLSWQGIGNEIPGLCWLPQIDSKGSTNIEGVLDIRCKPNGINFLTKGIEVNGSEYVIVADKSAIKSDDSETVLIWRMYLDNTGNSTVRLMRDNLKIHSKSVLVKIGNNYEKLTLWGKYEILETVKVGNTILVLNKDQWKSNIPFAVLTSSNKNDTYHRVNLVNLLLDPLVSAEKKLVIGAGEKENVSQYQSAIEIPPKGE